jgi:hypothetical protein
MTGLDVVELLGVEDVLPVMGKKGRHRGDDAGPVGAGQCQHELMIGHGAAWLGSGWTGVSQPCSITRDDLAPIPAEASNEQQLMIRVSAKRLQDHA